MKRILVGVFIILLPYTIWGQLAPPQSVAVSDDIFALRDNPAGLGVQPGFQFSVVAPLKKGSTNEPSYYLGGGDQNGGMGIALYKSGKFYQYRLGFSNALFPGMYLGYDVNVGKATLPSYSLGLLYRPFRFVSLGAVGYNLTSSNGLSESYRAGVGLRPFGNRLTFGADALLDASGTVTDAKFIVSTELVDGISVDAFFARENKVAGISLGFNLAHHGIRAIRKVSGTMEEFSHPVGVYHYTEARRRSLLAPVTPNKFVLIEIKGELPEERPRFTLFGKRSSNLTDMVQRIHRYAQQKDIAGIVLYIKGSPGGPAKIEELRRALGEFRGSGKQVYAYLDRAGNSTYLLATAANKIFLNPAGDVWLTGLTAQMVYVKSLLEKLGIQPNFVHIGKYKSASEMFTRDSSSSANLEQLNAYLDDYYQTFTTDIARSRNISLDRVKSLIDQGPYGAQNALKAGLVDSLLYHDQLRALIEQDGNSSGKHLVTLQEEKQATDWQYNWETSIRKKIAVIFAVGPITPGESEISPFTGSVSMGAATIVRAIRTARKNPGIQAIVLRVDSPGGSALASDIIWREVHLATTGEHPKPVIVSMGDVAASGGYYISMAADSIVAEPGTITGSIGVVFGQFSYQNLMEKIGVHAQTLQRGENADFLDPTRAFTEHERSKVYELIDTTYQAFVNKAAAARDLPADSVNHLGQGRIYSGTAAVQVGLVDALGGITKAIDMAKRAANIPPEALVELEYLPNYPLNFFDLLTSTPTLKYNTFFPNEILNTLKQTEQVNLLSSEKILYIIPYEVKVDPE